MARLSWPGSLIKHLRTVYPQAVAHLGTNPARRSATLLMRAMPLPHEAKPPWMHGIPVSVSLYGSAPLYDHERLHDAEKYVQVDRRIISGLLLTISRTHLSSGYYRLWLCMRVRAVYAIFGKVGRFASVSHYTINHYIIATVFRSYFMVWRRGSTKSDLSSLGFTVFFMKLFTTNNIEIVKECQQFFNFSVPSIQWLTRCKNFNVKYCESDNLLSKYLHLNKFVHLTLTL